MKNKIFFIPMIICLIGMPIESAFAAPALCTPTGTSCAECTKSRCNSGYYGDGYSCRSCSSYTGHANATSDKGSTVITDCYLPSGTAYSDNKGVGQISGGSCQYVS